MTTLTYWQQQAITRQRIITKQDRTIAQLRARLRTLEAQLGIESPTFVREHSCSE